METLAWFEATGFSVLMRESGLAFFGSLVLHALGMAFIVGAHLAIDLRLLGFAPGVPLPRLREFRPVLRASLFVVTLSGGLLLAAYPAKALTNPLFYVKLTAVGVALLVGRTLWVGAIANPLADSGQQSARAKGLAALSVLLWLTAITSGRFLAYTYSILMAADASFAPMTDVLFGIGRDLGIHRVMNSMWGWPIVESLHFTGLSFLIGAVGLYDLRMLGVARGVPMGALHRLIPWGVAGYALNVVTGLMFFTSAPDQYLYNPAFQVKLALMAVAGLNVLFFYRFVFGRVAHGLSGERAPQAARMAAGVSLTCWIGVIVCGRLITYYRPPYHWCWWCG